MIMTVSPNIAAFAGYISNGSSGIAGTILTVVSVTSGTIVPGMLIAGTGITADTYIVSNGTGTGNIGTYNVNVSQVAGTSTSPISITSNGVLTSTKNIARARPRMTYATARSKSGVS
jgi:hypothetical protein